MKNMKILKFKLENHKDNQNLRISNVTVRRLNFDVKLHLKFWDFEKIISRKKFKMKLFQKNSVESIKSVAPSQIPQLEYVTY